MTQGRFVTIDGPNGSGKSTAAAAVSSELRRHGFAVVETAEPTASPLGQMARAEEGRLGNRAYAALIASDRYYHLDSEVLPAIAEGKVVVSARYVESSLALQPVAGVPIDTVWALNCAVKIPDLSVVLSVSPDTLKKRLDERPALSAFEIRHSRARECDAYRAAVAFMRTRGFNVLDIPNDNSTPLSVTVSRIVDAILHLETV